MLIKDFYCDKMQVRAFDTREAMGECAGNEIAACMRKLLSMKKTINVMFAAAPSQNETLATLKTFSDIDWNRVNAFHMDEYVGLDPSNPAGFANFLKRSIFEEKPFRSVNLINGNAVSPQKEAKRYSAILKDNPIDVCILGVGENGHIAFNDPHVADFDDPELVKVVELEPKCRMQQVHDGCFVDINDVPTHALSVTIPGLVRAEYMFCSVPSSTKSDAIFHMLTDEISTRCPATILRRQDFAKLYVDKDSGKLII